MGVDGQWWEHPTYGGKESHAARVTPAYRIGSTAVGNGEHAPTFDMPELWNGLQGDDCNAKRAPGLAKLCDEAGKD